MEPECISLADVWKFLRRLQRHILPPKEEKSSRRFLFSATGLSQFVTAWTSCGSGNVCVGVNICMNNGALRAVKKLYIRLCAARDTIVE
jgi:hypothetical protein